MAGNAAAAVPGDMQSTATMTVAPGMEIPVDPRMMDGVEHHEVQYVQQLHQQQVGDFAAPVAPMHSHHMTERDIATQASRLQQQHAAAVEAARAALTEGGDSLAEDDRGGGDMKDRQDRHLLETLTAELKRGGYGEDGGQV